MKIEKYSNNSYRVRKKYKNQTISVYFDHKPTQKEATQVIYEKIDHMDTNSDSFGNCARKYVDIKEKVLSPSTLRCYRGYLKTIPSYFMDLPISKVNQIECQSLVNNLSQKVSPKTVRNYHGFVISVLNMFEPNVKINVTMPRKEKTDDYIPSSEEIRSILEAVKGTKWYIVFLLGCYGLRRSEILPLTADDVNDGFVDIVKTMVLNDKKEWIIKPIGKTDESLRRVPIPQELENLIKKQGYAYKGHPSVIIDQLHRTQKQLGIQEFRFHLLRHYFATEMSQILSEADVMALGGWSTPYVMKKVYRHQRIMDDKKRQQEIANIIKEKLL